MQFQGEKQKRNKDLEEVKWNIEKGNKCLCFAHLTFSIVFDSWLHSPGFFGPGLELINRWVWLSWGLAPSRCTLELSCVPRRLWVVYFLYVIHTGLLKNLLYHPWGENPESALKQYETLRLNLWSIEDHRKVDDLLNFQLIKLREKL